MYRVIAFVSAGILLAACSAGGESPSTGQFKNPFAPKPAMETVRFESQPPGAEAKTSTGQSCRTPCALALPAEKPFTVTYTLTGFQPQTENIELVSQGDGTSSLRPNPVLVELTAAPQQKKKPPAKRRVSAKPKPKPKAQAQQPAAAAPPPPMQPAAQPRTNSPWPSNPPTR
jgi:hypothetical protein